MKIKLFFTISVLLTSVAAHAHDFWIEPASYNVRRGERVTFTLRVGEHLHGDVVPRMPWHLKAFKAKQASSVTTIAGEPNAAPAGEAAFNRQGPAVVTYESNARVSSLSQAKFKQYVAEEGLEQRVATLGLSNKSRIRDSFSRQAKTLLAIDSDTIRDEQIGLPFEIVALTELGEVARNKQLRARVYFRGKPLSGALVVAISRAEPSVPVSARSDANGYVTLPLERGGMWFIKSVHLIPASDPNVADVESFWASLTFDVPSGRVGE